MKLMAWVPAVALAATLAACGTSAPTVRTETHSDYGTVTGTFMRVGGPLGVGGIQPPSIPLMGTLQFTADHHRSFAVKVGKTGRFAVRLPAGHYVVAGTSPSMAAVLASGALDNRPCTPPTPVTVVAHRTVHVSLVCPVP
jgi:hypothetical protein